MNSPSLATAVEAWKRLWRLGKGDDQEQPNTSKAKNTQATRNKTKQRQTKKETMKGYQQRTLLGVNLDLQDVEAFSDPLQVKQEQVLQVGLHNLANLSQDKRTSKSRQLIITLSRSHLMSS